MLKRDDCESNDQQDGRALDQDAGGERSPENCNDMNGHSFAGRAPRHEISACERAHGRHDAEQENCIGLGQPCLDTEQKRCCHHARRDQRSAA